MPRFNTLDKKPKVWNIAVLTAIFLVITVLLVLFKALTYPLAMILVCLYCILCIFFLIRACFRQLRYNPYSYNTVYYIGFSLFLFLLLLDVWLLAIRIMRMPELDEETRLFNLLGVLNGSAKQFILYLSPFMLLYSLALCFSNFILIRKEGRSFVNMLGVILFLLLQGGLTFLFVVDYYASGSVYEVMRHEIWTNSFAAVYVYFECMLIGVLAANLIVIEYRPDKDADFLITLGCAIRDDGTPTPLLAGRLDKALAFYAEQKKENGKKIRFITSGGQGEDEVISESRSMKNYLVSKGIPEEDIYLEERSTNTYENMKYSKEIVDSIDPDAKVLFSTTNFHVFRSGLLARRVKMKAIGLGADTKWYFWPNALVREFVGLVSEHRLKQVLILSGMILVYAGITVFSYLYR